MKKTEMDQVEEELSSLLEATLNWENELNNFEE
jgi:hypothetical protein